ncbi:MAG: hypothetical protein MJ252_28900, partial [archaeon]|nr:hypothetical protein [archaeon]
DNIYLLSCSNDKTIKIFEGNSPYGTIQILKCHKTPILNILQLKDGRLVSYTADGCLNLYEFESTVKNKKEETKEDLKETKIFQEKFYSLLHIKCCYRNAMIQNLKGLLLIGGENFLTVVDVKNQKVLKVFKGISHVNSFLVLKDRSTLFSMGNSIYRIYDNYEIATVMETVSNDNITSLVPIADNKIAASAGEGIIYILTY